MLRVIVLYRLRNGRNMLCQNAPLRRFQRDAFAARGQRTIRVGVELPDADLQTCSI